MQRPSALDGLFWFLALLSAFALALLVLVLAGAIPIGPASAPPTQPEPAAAPGPTSTSEEEPPARTTAERTTPAATTTGPDSTESKAPASAVVVVTATRGDSWVSARDGSESGELLEERLLPQGESIRLEARRVWLSLGAAGNVDVTVDGKPRSLGNGTVSGILAPAAANARS